MSKARVTVHERLTAEEARRAVLALVAMGLDAETHRDPHFEPGHLRRLAEHSDDAGASAAAAGAAQAAASNWLITVTEEEVGAALPILADGVTASDTVHAPPRPILGDAAAIWTLGNASASIVLAVLCVTIHLIVHQGGGPSPRSTMIAAGVSAPWLVADGQWWRLLSAAFLHFDIKHLVGNMSSLLFLGPPLAAAIGQLRLVVLFVVTGIFGNIVSHFLGNDAAIKAGASGGICGLLGALAGVAIGAMAVAADARERRPAWQTLGALVALFGMIVGFAPGHDHYAHLGGLVSGVVLGGYFGARASGASA